MSVLRRWLQPSFRKALAAEAAGELEEAARFYALSGQRDKVADMHLRLAERSTDGLGRIQSLRNALDWLDHDADVRVVEVALASAILARAKVEGTTCARDVELNPTLGTFPGTCYVESVKTAQAKVIRGAIVTRARFPDGTRLTLVEHDERKPIVLDPDDEAAILKGIQEIEAGRGIHARSARARLRRR